MNDHQSNRPKIDRDVHFEDIMLADAWRDVEHTFRSAGEVAPLPGFTARWMQRLELERQRVEKRQAAALILTNLIIALGFLVLIGLQFVPAVSSGGLLSLWVELLSRIVVTVQTIVGVIGAFVRTIPAVLPTSWLVSAVTIMLVVIGLWVFMARRILVKQGVSHGETEN
jgi:hypothetical protein